jgi:hypothetical protein
MRRTSIPPEANPIPRTHWRGWQALPLAGLGALLLGLGVSGPGCWDPEPRVAAEEADKAAFPKAVSEALDRAARVYPQPLGGARWSQVHVLSGSDHPVYQVQGTNGRGNRIEAEVTSAGRVVEVEEHGIPLGEVPGAVFDALRAKMPQFKVTRAEAIYQAQKAEPVCYGFEGHDAGKEIEIYLSADGKTFLNR